MNPENQKKDEDVSSDLKAANLMILNLKTVRAVFIVLWVFSIADCLIIPFPYSLEAIVFSFIGILSCGITIRILKNKIEKIK